MAGGRFELAMEPTAIGLVLPNSNICEYWRLFRVGNSIQVNAIYICDARLIYGRGGFHGYLYDVQLSEHVLLK